MSDSPWYETFFDEAYLEQYGPLLTDEHSERQVDLIIDRLGLEPGARILDLACGHGRHAIRLARRGYEVTGLDLSRVFLDHAAIDAKAAGAEVRWVHADMRAIPFEDEFDAVINIFTAFGYFEDEAEDVKALASVRKALKPGGALLLETIHRDGLTPRYQDNMFERHEEDDRYILHRHHLDLVRGAIEDHVVVVQGGKTIDRGRTYVRLYTVPEFKRLLEEAGMALEEVWGGLGGKELTLKSFRLALLARRPPLR